MGENGLPFICFGKRWRRLYAGMESSVISDDIPRVMRWWLGRIYDLWEVLIFAHYGSTQVDAGGALLRVRVLTSCFWLRGTMTQAGRDRGRKYQAAQQRGLAIGPMQWLQERACSCLRSGVGC